MTVIAWDGRTVAADSQGIVGCGHRSPLRSAKIVLHEGVIFGTTGRMGPMREAWIGWYLAGARPDCVPPMGIGHDDAGNLVVFRDGRCFVFSALVPYACEEAAPFAFGSGADYAIGAMMAGANAAKAVQIAIACDVNCGGEIDAIEL